MATTAQAIVQDWMTQAEAEVRAGKAQLPGANRAATKLRTLKRLVAKDLPTFMEEEAGEPVCLSQVDLDALQILLDARPPPQAEALKKQKAALPAEAPAELVNRAYDRVMATRSVAADKLGETDPLTVALGFRVPVEKTPGAVSAALDTQRKVLRQKDAQGHDLPSAAANRARFKAIGLSDGYAKRKLDPLVAQLSPFLGRAPVTPGPVESLSRWEVAAVIAASHYLTAAERVLDNTDRVLQYRNAQPLSKAGRFTKRAIAQREAAANRRAEKKAERDAEKLQRQQERDARKAAKKLEKEAKAAKKKKPLPPTPPAPPAAP